MNKNRDRMFLKIDTLLDAGEITLAEKKLFEIISRYGSSTETTKRAMFLVKTLGIYDFENKLVIGDILQHQLIYVFEIANFLRATNDHGSAINLYSYCIENNIKPEQSSLQKIECLLESGNANTAVLECEAILSDLTKTPKLASLYLEAMISCDYLKKAQLYFDSVETDFLKTPELIAGGAALAFKAKDYELAISRFKNALELDPSNRHWWRNLALTYKDYGKPKSAIKAIEKSLSFSPQNPVFYSDYIYMLYSAKHKDQNYRFGKAKYFSQLVSKTEKSEKSEKVSKRKDIRLPQGGAIRVGFISSDLKQHPVTHFFLPLLQSLVKLNIEVYCYSNLPPVLEDTVSQLIKESSNTWRNIAMSNNELLAKTIAEDKIDILIDLNGHTANNRLSVFSYRPSPIQATYLGFFATTGMREVDYWLTDYALHPLSTNEKSSEQIFRFSRSWVCFKPPEFDLNTTSTNPQNAPIVFGCFSDSQKYNNEIIDTWSEIMRQAPNALLHLQTSSFSHESLRKRVTNLFHGKGIEPERISFHGKQSYLDYLNQYKSVDVVLDTFPRSGGTTTVEALWMGVPVITIAGECYAERISTSKLTYADLEEYVVHSRQDYINRALQCAKNVANMRERRHTVRSKLLSSSICDPEGLAHDFLAALNSMAEQYNRQIQK